MGVEDSFLERRRAHLLLGFLDVLESKALVSADKLLDGNLHVVLLVDSLER